MLDKYISLVKNFYNEEHRCFHDWGHIEYGLDVFNNLGKGSLEQKIAWLFHDIIYDPTKKDNEYKSSLLAVNMINNEGDHLNVNTNIVSIIINDTKNHQPTHPESALVLDIDMSSLAINDYQLFFESRIKAAKEYAEFGKEAVIAGTKSFISETLHHPRIFTTDDFLPMEEIARRNLNQYLQEFEKSNEFREIFTSKTKNKFKL